MNADKTFVEFILLLNLKYLLENLLRNKNLYKLCELLYKIQKRKKND